MELKGMPGYDRQLFCPDPLLLRFIEYYCILTPSAPALVSVPWHIMPDGAAHILLHVYDDSKNKGYRCRLTYVGPRSRFIFTDRRGRVLSLVARLRPGVSLLPMSVPIIEFKDRAVSLEDLFRTDLSVPMGELAMFAGACQIHELIKSFNQLMNSLLDKPIQQNALLEKAVQTIGRSKGQMPVRSLASTLGVSDRHLRSLFKAKVGLSPKRYSRIMRLTEVVKMVDGGYVHGWAQLALATGYYDQSHMIDEFQELVGESPDAFVTRINREDVLLTSSDFSNT